jgi:hypothetical protein
MAVMPYKNQENALGGRSKHAAGHGFDCDVGRSRKRDGEIYDLHCPMGHQHCLAGVDIAVDDFLDCG